MGDRRDPRQAELLPVVRYAARQRVKAKPDYWDHATLLELAVLAGDEAAAEEHLGDALAVMREGWKAKTTARNLGLIAARRRERGEEVGWLDEVVAELVVAKGTKAG